MPSRPPGGRAGEILLPNPRGGAPNTPAGGGVKEQLEAKIQELGKLVADLGVGRTEKTGSTPRRFPTVGWGRGLGEVVDGSDGRLPAIREDKYYPRRTLEYARLICSFDEGSS